MPRQLSDALSQEHSPFLTQALRLSPALYEPPPLAPPLNSMLPTRTHWHASMIMAHYIRRLHHHNQAHWSSTGFLHVSSVNDAQHRFRYPNCHHRGSDLRRKPERHTTQSLLPFPNPPSTLRTDMAGIITSATEKALHDRHDRVHGQRNYRSRV